MPLRPPAGFISANYDPLKNPDAPTGVSATGGDASASVSFTAPANVGGSAITAYYAVSNPSQVTVSGTSSPINVTGLSNGTAYTFQVWALNSFGPGPFSAASGSVTPAAPRGVFGGGSNNIGYINVLQYVTISTTGNATDFGDLTIAAQDLSGLGSATRGIYGGFYYGASPDINTINYITFATTGDAVDFGDMISQVRTRAGFNSATRGVFAGGLNSGGTPTAAIEYITIASTGNGTNFGNMSNSSRSVGCSSPTRGLMAETYISATFSNVIEYVTIASTGNATDFGDLTVSRLSLGSGSNATRGVFAGGYDVSSTVLNVIDYVTIATTGNATDFGDLSAARYDIAGASSSTRIVFAGAKDSSFAAVGFLDYITIGTTGNSTNFGNLVSTAYACGACSNTNGGVQ
jgi:hypothetical protein